MTRRLTAAEARTVRLALYLAEKWEASLIDALTPIFNKPAGTDAQAIRRCRRNITAFRRIAASLRDAKEG